VTAIYTLELQNCRALITATDTIKIKALRSSLFAYGQRHPS